MNLTKHLRKGLMLNILSRQKAKINNNSVIIAYYKILDEYEKLHIKNNVIRIDRYIIHNGNKINFPLILKDPTSKESSFFEKLTKFLVYIIRRKYIYTFLVLL